MSSSGRKCPLLGENVLFWEKMSSVVLFWEKISGVLFCPLLGENVLFQKRTCPLRQKVRIVSHA